MLLPAGADGRFADSAVLWNAAEAAERRKDAQVAREIVLALPANAELTDRGPVDLARSFAEQHFVAKGLAVQLDVHAPHEGESDSERANWHAHLLITTRRIEGDAVRGEEGARPRPRGAARRRARRGGGRRGLGRAVARSPEPVFRGARSRRIRVDPAATHAQEHIGPVRMRKAGSEIVERAETIRQANEAAARDPEQVLATLTRNNATFSERDLDRHLAKHIADEAERAVTKAAVLGHAETLPLYDRTSGEAAERYTTKTVRTQERAALADAGTVAAGAAIIAVCRRRRSREPWRRGRCGRISARRSTMRSPPAG